MSKRRKKSETKQTKKLKNISVKINDLRIWQVLTFVFLALFAWSYFFHEVSTTGCTTKSTSVLQNKAMNFINSQLVAPGTSASFKSISEIGCVKVYNITTEYMGREIPVYVTGNGNIMFLSAFDISKVSEEKTETKSSSFDAPDAEIPQADLYVMSFCPFGNQAENNFKPVVDLLKDKINVTVRYIVSISQTQQPNALEVKTEDGTYYVRSLHGPGEAWEDLLEACIQKYYPTETFWDFIIQINDQCTQYYSNLEQLQNCSKTIAENLGINFNQMKTCAESSDGISILREDEKLTQQNGVTGSPTLFINGLVYREARTPEAYKNAVCSGFIEQPEECSETLSNGGSASNGNC
ncbi:MAG: DsbA family protein [Candidatus Aenigmarchaeota archaeon]|nr:DsbA family protein [Candidatus Aenigmarchaeota archaeon]